MKGHESERRVKPPHGSKPHPRHDYLAASLDGRLWRRTSNGSRWKEVVEDVLWLDQKTVRVLALVLECFIPKPGPKHKLSFLDGNRQNRAVENLIWVPIGHSDDLRNVARDRVANGESRHGVAGSLEIPYRTVCSWTEDLPKQRGR